MVSRAFLLAIALAAPVPAAADGAAPRGRSVTRDELRECLNRGDELAARRSPLATQRAEHERALAAQRAAGEVMAQQQAALDQLDTRSVTAFDAKAAAHNARGVELDAQTERLRDEGRRFNAAMIDHNARCGGIVFRAEDRSAILAERESEREQQRKKAGPR